MDCDGSRSRAQLVSRLRSGDPDAFDAGAPRIQCIGCTTSSPGCRSGRDVAEDLLEETWLRLVKHAGRLRPDTRHRPAGCSQWPATCTRATAVRGFSRIRTPSGLLGSGPHGRREPSPFEALESDQAVRRLAAGTRVASARVSRSIAAGRGRRSATRRSCSNLRRHRGSHASAGEPCARAPCGSVSPMQTWRASHV